MIADNVTVVAPARVHFGLVSLSLDSSRAYGGAGLAVWHQRTVVDAQRCAGSKVEVQGVPRDLSGYIEAQIKYAGMAGLSVRVREGIEPHIGLGSRTSLTLACLEASALVVGHDFSVQELRGASRRGAASGVGVHGYFSGGLVGDAGRSIAQVAEFLPSSAVQPQGSPRLLYHLEWPAEWKIAVLTLADEKGFSGKAEVDFFRRHTPMGRDDAGMSALALHFELPACVMDRDFAGLRTCLNWSGKTGFKAKEIASQPRSAELLRTLEQIPNVAAAMSSFGPSIVVITVGKTDVQQILQTHDVRDPWCVVSGDVCQSGRIISRTRVNRRGH
jgi:beta-ribofuranosylaminobenzene 5'-phosphate synthase